MLPPISKKTGYFTPSIVDVLFNQPKTKKESRILREKVNEQQKWMNSGPSKKGHTLAGNKLKSPKVECQSRKTNSLVLYNDENSPLADMNMDVEKDPGEFDKWGAVEADHILKKTRLPNDELPVESECSFDMPNSLVPYSNESTAPSSIEEDVPLDFDDLLKRIIAKDSDGEFVIYKPGEWDEIVPHLEVFEWSYFNLMLDIEENGCYPWHNPEIIKKSIPFIKYLAEHDTEALGKIIAMYDSKADSYKYPLENPEICKLMSPILTSLKADELYDMGMCEVTYSFILLQPIYRDMDSQKLIDIFSMHHGSALRGKENLIASLPVIQERLQLDDIVRLLSALDDNGHGVLQSPEEFIAALPVFKQMGPKETVSFFSLVDIKGLAPLFDESIFKAAIPFLETLDQKTLIMLLSITNRRGQTPLHCDTNLKLALPLLSRLDLDELEKLLAKQDNNEITIRQCLYDTGRSYPFVQALLFPKLKQLENIAFALEATQKLAREIKC